MGIEQYSREVPGKLEQYELWRLQGTVGQALE